MESDKLVEILKFLLGKCTVVFKFLTNARGPSRTTRKSSSL